MTRRDAWIAFLTEPESSERILNLSGASAYARSPAIEQPSLLEKLSPADSNLVVTLHLLLQDQFREFVLTVVPRFLRQLNRTTRDELTIHRKPKGNIAWQQTVRLRASARIDDAQFVLTERSSSLDIPENQLIKWFLKQVSTVAAWALQKLKSGNLATQLEALRETADKLINHALMREVSLPGQYTQLMRKRALRHRNRAYHQLVTVADQLRETLLMPNVQAVARLISAGWFQPISDDDLFEFYVLGRTLRELDKQATDVEYNLVGTTHSYVARLTNASTGLTLLVYFDKSPHLHLGVRSQYADLTSPYPALAARPHRPDITLQAQFKSGNIRTLLLEMKNSTGWDYLRESFYKAMAYLHDFSELWVDSAFFPHAVLVAPEIDDPPLADLKGLEVILVNAQESNLDHILLNFCTE